MAYEKYADEADETVTFLGGKKVNKKPSKRVVEKIVYYAALASIATLIAAGAVMLHEFAGAPFRMRDTTISMLKGRNLLPFFEYNQLVRFEQNMSFSGARAAPAWKNLNAKGGGWIIVEGGEEMGLGPPIRYDNKEGYGISVFHQLHCLEIMHEVYGELSRGNMTNIAPHVEHCFDYLRQVLMCHADLALEHRRVFERAGPDRDQVDGWGAVHQCRDWNAVVKFVEDHRMRRKGGDEHDHHHHHSSD